MQNQNGPQKQSQDKPAQPPPDTSSKSTLVLLDVKKLSGAALDKAIDKIIDKLFGQ